MHPCYRDWSSARRHPASDGCHRLIGLSYLTLNSLTLRLDVEIELQYLDLALVVPNIGYMDVLELGIGNEPQYQMAFTPPSPFTSSAEPTPLC